MELMLSLADLALAVKPKARYHIKKLRGVTLEKYN
jgi:hypothetical protein